MFQRISVQGNKVAPPAGAWIETKKDNRELRDQIRTLKANKKTFQLGWMRQLLRGPFKIIETGPVANHAERRRHKFENRRAARELVANSVRPQSQYKRNTI